MAAFFFLQKMKKDVIVNFADTERKREKKPTKQLTVAKNFIKIKSLVC